MNTRTMIRVSPQEFLRAYNLYDDGMYQVVLVAAMRRLEPVFKKQDTGSPQAWVDSFARTVHETSQRHNGDAVIFTTDADELGEFVDEAMMQ